MTFKEKLVILRKKKHLTQDEFASAVGVSRQAVYKWESGQSYPEVPKLLEMKLLFGITIDELLDDTYDIELPEKKKRKKIAKDEKREIERTVAENVEKAPKATAPKVAPAPKAAPAPVAAPAPKAEPEIPVFTPVSAVKEEPVFTPVADVPKFTPVEAEPEMPKYSTVSDLEDKEEKKQSFFGRLFGRK